MGGAGSGRKKKLNKAIRGSVKATANFKEMFFKAIDQYQVEYNAQQITNSNRLYQYIYEIFDGMSSIRFARLINQYKKERKGDLEDIRKVPDKLGASGQDHNHHEGEGKGEGEQGYAQKRPNMLQRASS